MVKFLRRTGDRYSKLGKGRKKKQVWRKPTGRDNKMREKRKGYPAVISVGYKKEKKLRGIIEGKELAIVKNIKELENVKKNEIAVIGSIGKKKKIEMAKKAREMKIQIHNLNIEKFLKRAEKRKAKEEKTEKPKSKEKEKKEEKPKEKPKEEKK